MTYALGLIKEDYTAAPFNIPAGIVYKAVLQKPLPASFDTRLSIFPVRDQLKQGACAAFSASTVCQNLEHWSTTAKLQKYLSPQYIYNCRPNTEEGMDYSGVQDVLQNFGVVLEEDYVYGETICLRDAVPAALIATGKKHEMRQFAAITSLDELKAAMVYHQAGVMLAFKVYNFGLEFFKQHPGETLQGYHSVTGVAYDDAAQQITIQNSWGSTWGNQGFTVMSYDDFNNHVQEATLSFVDIQGGTFDKPSSLFWRILGYK